MEFIVTKVGTNAIRLAVKAGNGLNMNKIDGRRIYVHVSAIPGAVLNQTVKFDAKIIPWEQDFTDQELYTLEG